MANKWEKYEISGDTLKRKNKSCPKCGDGVFMAKHSDRETCGKCGYTEFRKRQESSQEPRPEPKQES